MQSYEKKKLKYETKDTEFVFKAIRASADSYFAKEKNKKFANNFMWFKCISLTVLVAFSYYFVLHSNGLLMLIASYLLLGFSFLTLGINIGHDAAHHCFTGKKSLDSLIFQLVFGLQGMSGYLWQLRHNLSHHIFPNVNENDSDLDLTPLLLITPNQKVYWFHKYQHIYAPFLYGVFSLLYIFAQDILSFFKKEHGNLRIVKIPTIEWIKLFSIKALYVFNFIVLPAYLTSFSISQVLLAFVCMHFILSIYLSFTFFISHHVSEVDYFDTLPQEPVIGNSWIKHQIITTIDFHPDNKFANFLFGGFNLHIAHHIFPDVSHVHYPALTRIIRTTLNEYQLDWYKSFSFLDGIKSHLRHLKNKATEIMNSKENLDNDALEDEIFSSHITEAV